MKFLPFLLLLISLTACSQSAQNVNVKSIEQSEIQLPLEEDSDASGIKWISLSELEEKMKQEPRKIYIDVYTSWCGPCKMMMKNTFTNPVIIDYLNENYYAVKFDAESGDTITFKGQEYVNPNYRPNSRGRNGTHQLTMTIANVGGRIAYPTSVFIDENWNLITGLQGYLTPERIEPVLNYVSLGLYEQNEDYQEFLKTFESQIK